MLSYTITTSKSINNKNTDQFMSYNTLYEIWLCIYFKKSSSSPPPDLLFTLYFPSINNQIFSLLRSWYISNKLIFFNITSNHFLQSSAILEQSSYFIFMQSSFVFTHLIILSFHFIVPLNKTNVQECYGNLHISSFQEFVSIPFLKYNKKSTKHIIFTSVWTLITEQFNLYWKICFGVDNFNNWQRDFLFSIWFLFLK